MFSMGFVSGLLSFVLCIWDFATYPIYFMIDQPWRVTRYDLYIDLFSNGDDMALCRMIERTRARVVSTEAKEITIKAVPLPSPTRVGYSLLLFARAILTGAPPG